MTWTTRAILPEDVTGKDVLEVGSYDVNGSVRPFVEGFGPKSYTGVDVLAGPGVDRVVDAERLTDVLGVHCADLVISTEMLEHCDNWQKVIQQMVAALHPGGVLIITTRSIGFPYHHPPDRWRYDWQSMLDIFELHAGLTVEALSRDPEQPGVFLRARKPAGWTGWPQSSLDDVEGVTWVLPVSPG